MPATVGIAPSFEGVRRCVYMKDLLKKIVLLLMASAGLAFLVNGLSPRGIPLMGQWHAASGVVTADSDAAAVWMEFEIPDPEMAKAVFDKGKAIFIDVRSRDRYDEGHIPGALSLPLSEFDARADALSAEIPRQRPIVTYCSGRLCQDSHTAAQMLMERGFENVVVFIDGYPGWIEHGYPAEAS
jgi:rhodanese-related sulfurtransferase